MTFDEWMTLGIQNGWCSHIVCETHDGLPITPDEELEWEQGNDPCMSAVRIYGEA